MSRFACLLILLGSLVGCGEHRPTTVFGKVLFRKTPLHSGIVVFVPDEDHGCHGPLLKAEIQPNGSYSLNSEDTPSVPAGWYRITLTAIELHNHWINGKAVDRPHSILPAKYGDPQLSGLHCEVKRGKKNEVLLNLD